MLYGIQNLGQDFRRIEMATKKKPVVEKVKVEEPVAIEDEVKASTVEIKISDEELLETKKKAYERVIEINKVDLDRMVDSTQTSFQFQDDSAVAAQAESLKEAKAVYPPLVNACLAEMKRRGLDTEALQKYFDSIEYTKPWLRM